MNKNEIKIFNNDNFNVKVRINENDEYEFDAESVARSLGFVEVKNGKEYIRWRTVNGYLDKYLSQDVAKGSYIPEPMIYKLSFKASNDVAEKFQDWLAIEVLPEIRKTGTYAIPKAKRSDTPSLTAVNKTAEILTALYKDAEVEPKFIAVAVNNLYKNQRGIELNIPIIYNEAKLYDKTAIAEKFGIYSQSGKPHPQAVGAIIGQIVISNEEYVNTPYNRNGHSGVDVQYKESVCNKVEGWLCKNNYPEEIMSDGGKKCKVVYK